MLTSIKNDALPPFFRHIDTGFITHRPVIRYSLVNFDVHYYQDEMFDSFHIPFPEKLNSAVAKRRAEYLAVRYAAGMLLQASGCTATPGTRPDRAPVWPTGWCGSLSHADGYAIALVAPQDAGVLPGIDIEAFAPTTMKETVDVFTDANEQALLADCDIAYETALLIAFSAKESLFKALHPLVGYFFGFEAARVRKIECTRQRITLELTQTLTPDYPCGTLIVGDYTLLNNHVITLIIEQPAR